MTTNCFNRAKPTLDIFNVWLTFPVDGVHKEKLLDVNRKWDGTPLSHVSNGRKLVQGKMRLRLIWNNTKTDYCAFNFWPIFPFDRFENQLCFGQTWEELSVSMRQDSHVWTLAQQRCLRMVNLIWSSRLPVRPRFDGSRRRDAIVRICCRIWK